MGNFVAKGNFPIGHLIITFDNSDVAEITLLFCSCNNRAVLLLLSMMAQSKQSHALFIWLLQQAIIRLAGLLLPPNNPLRICGSSCSNAKSSNRTIIPEACCNRSTLGQVFAHSPPR